MPITETASGLNDRRPKLRKLLADPTVGSILVEYRKRLTRFGVGMVDAMLQARGGRLLVIVDAEVLDDFGKGYDRNPHLLLRPALRPALRSKQSTPRHSRRR